LRQGEKLYEELLIGKDTTGTLHPRILAAKEKSHPWQYMKDSLTRLQSYIDQNNIPLLFSLLEEMDIEFNQKYPISDPLYIDKANISDNVVSLNIPLNEG